MAVSNFLKNEMLKMETRAMFPYLVEVTDPDGNIYRYANSDEDIEYTETDDDGNEVTNTFEASFFKVTPPQKTTDGVKDAKITFSTVDQTWITRIRSYTSRASIRFIAIIKYDDDNNSYCEPIDEINFKLTKASWNETTVQWTMMFDDRMSVNFPATKLTSLTCPALF